MLMIEGPLALALRAGAGPGAAHRERRDHRRRSAPRPRACAPGSSQNIHVEGRPEWVFVKVHTHGAPETQAASLLGDGGRTLHDALTTRYNDGKRWTLHYVTAREMFNVAIAAMDGKTGDPGAFRDYVLPPPPVATA